jgi:hypothetical protein
MTRVAATRMREANDRLVAKQENDFEIYNWARKVRFVPFNGNGELRMT